MTVSIALCTYNGEKFIEQQIQSFLSQSVLPDEIVICDDGSKDATRTIIQTFEKQNPAIKWRVFQNKKNLEVARNFEKAIGLCSMDIIFLSDQDDIWKKNKIERVLQFFNHHPACDAIFSNADLIDEEGHLQEGTLLDNSFFKADIRKNYKKEDFFYWSILLGNIMTGATMCLRSTIFSDILPFHLNPGRKLLHDGWLGFSLMAKGTIEYLDECLTQYRVHPEQQVGVIKRNDPFPAIVVRKENITMNIREYFQRYLAGFSFLQKFKQIKPVSNQVEQRITTEYLEQKEKYFKSQSFLQRKLRLLKWWLKGVNFISFSDLVRL